MTLLPALCTFTLEFVTFQPIPMKNFYTRSLVLFFLVLLARSVPSYAQCVDGSEPNPVFSDTTIAFETGVTSTTVKFPQFDPEQGMVSCVKLTVTMIGVVDSVTMQNKSNGNTTANFYYIRSDSMTGPGLSSTLSNGVNQRYGPYSLTPYDGNTTSGTDYVYIENDTAVKAVVTRKLTDSTEISQFYGHDSVAYKYDISVMTSASIGGTANSSVATSALVNFRFEYCKCPKVALPVGLKNFTLAKTSGSSANLRWEGENDEYAYGYDVEMSRDGKHFYKIATVNRKYETNPSFLYSYQMAGNDFGRYYFRVRQHWLNGYVRFTAVKTVEFNSSIFEATTLYPNPSNGNAGIKFVNSRAGKVLVQITNAHGQPVSSKELTVSATDYQLLPKLPAGVYWVKIIDLASKAYCVKQLLVQ